MESTEQLIAQYQPNHDGATLLAHTPIVLIVGIAGAGKNSLLTEMLKSGNYYDLITSITREPRYNNGVLEQHGVEYYFLSEEEAIEKIKNGEYVEVSSVHGRIYGVTADEMRRAHDAGKQAIADVDVQGVMKYKRISDHVTAIFLLPPSYEEWRRRLETRYSSHEAFLEDWPTRRDSAIVELEKALASPYYHFVINNDVAEAAAACEQIIASDDTFHRKDDEKRLIARDILDEIRAHA